MVEDDYELDHTPQDLWLSLLTASGVALEADGIIRLTPAELPNGRFSAGGMIRYNCDQFAASVETLAINDNRMIHVWGGAIHRIRLSAVKPQQCASWKLELREASCK